MKTNSAYESASHEDTSTQSFPFVGISAVHDPVTWQKATPDRPGFYWYIAGWNVPRIVELEWHDCSARTKQIDAVSYGGRRVPIEKFIEGHVNPKWAGPLRAPSA